MKLFALISVGVLFFVLEFVLFNILPDKTKNKFYMVLSFIASFFLLFLGVIFIYNWGKYWNMEAHVKIIIGACCYISLFASILYNRFTNR